MKSGLIFSVVLLSLSIGLNASMKSCTKICGRSPEAYPKKFDAIINGLTRCEEKKTNKITNTRKAKRNERL